ncbi:DUF3122 domain-containing protein [Hydrocoleum sp. CS-953]|uniref:DUF3122 domain-containing protein n=1 Tax=Microcoleaceae TaxID=1892252 RepID=UPI000B9BA467|nr:DUF3122 domain-containing protein [Hydrocoleum sp. CS-953]OZH53346.1 hypothetical protein AFK68_18235 [Hydrocoleum sp. CS-953]
MIKQFFSQIMLIIGLVFLILVYQGSFKLNSANALIREIEETPAQIVYQVKHTLRDEERKPWQVVFYKRLKSGELDTINLRLVGFPGTVEFTHPQPLKISYGQNKISLARDNFAEKAPATNVGEYQFPEVLFDLETNAKIFLSLPLKTNQPAKIKIPFPVLLEWQEVISRK